MFKPKNIIIIVLLTTAPFLGCSAKDDSEQVRNLIHDGAALAQAHQIGDLLDLTTERFVALPGSYDRRRIKGVLFAAFQHYGQFKIHFPRPSVEIDPDGKFARTVVYFMIVSQSHELPGLKDLYDNPRGWLEAAAKKADLYQLKLQLSKDSGEWRVKLAILEGFTGKGF